jgi:DNA-binding transcriptional LysR family regulator
VWVVAGRAGHPILEGASRLKDLAGARWLTGPRSGPLEAAIVARFQAEGVAAPAIDTVTTSILYALSTISRQDLLCVLPLSIVRRWPGLIHRDLGGDAWKTDLVLMRRRRAVASEAETALIAFLSEDVRTR